MHVSKAHNSPRAVQRLRGDFARRGVLVVDDVFAGPWIDRLYAAAASSAFVTRFREGSYRYGTLRSCELQETLRDPLPPGAHLCDQVREALGCSLCSIAAALARPAITMWCARVTGTPVGVDLTLMMSRFGPGDHLGLHDDTAVDFAYRLAFILYLNPVWDTAWGGHLRILSRDAGWMTIQPRSNRLVLFVPNGEVKHEVKPIDSAAPTPRFAVSGWYLDPDVSW